MSFLSMKGAAMYTCAHTQNWESTMSLSFMVDQKKITKKKQLSLHKGWAKWSWTTDSVALNITVQFVIYSAPD